MTQTAAASPAPFGTAFSDHMAVARTTGGVFGSWQLEPGAAPVDVS